MNLPPVILASQSPRRSELLRQLGFDFRVVPGRIQEVQPEHLTPHETAQINAYRKARVVAKKHPDSLVIGADTVVSIDSEIFGKPHDRAQARRMLEALAGRPHHVITGLCLLHLRRHRQSLFAVSTRVTFRPLDSRTIDEYLNLIHPFDKAGAYAIQEHGHLIVESIEGSYTNVVGLPLERLGEELRAWSLESSLPLVRRPEGTSWPHPRARP
ncbi:MAG TPA: Maf family protein [Methylomirabilota bacterium]|nr:Maf family protein [Methylomirabilota bacterium]